MILEFFIAFFGISYIVIRLLRERRKGKEYERRVKEEDAQMRKWVASATDSFLESKMERKIKELNMSLHEDGDIKEAYGYVFKHYNLEDIYPKQLLLKMDFYSNPEKAKATIMRDHDRALLIMMAKHGKLPARVICGYGETSDPCLNTKLDVSFYPLDGHIMWWCASEIRKHGDVKGFYVSKPTPHWVVVD